MDSGHIFVSYSTTDRVLAETLTQLLEGRGVRVWIAPRDVRPGHDYSEELHDAIEEASAVIALISDHSNRSRHVKAEIEIAFSRGKPLFPVRFDEVMPTKGLALFLGLGHWTDLFGPHEATNLARLVGELSHRPGAPIAPAPPPLATPRPPVPPPAPPPSPPPASPVMAPRPRRDNKLAVVVISASLTVIATVALLAALRSGREPDPRPMPSDPVREIKSEPVPRPQPDPPLPDPVPVPAPVPPTADANWIVGQWAMSNEPCAGVAYTADGQWATRGGGGYWRIEGSTLVNTTVFRIRDGQRFPVNQAPVRYQALSIGPNEIQLRFPGGSVETLRRC